MVVFNTLIILLFAYLFIYCVYQIFFYTKARNIEEYIEQQEKSRSSIMHIHRLCVIIFASAKDKNLDKLLIILNNQTYLKEFYEIHVIYKKDDSDTMPMRDFALGARIHNIQNPDYFSKNKAVNLFIQKIIPDTKFDAFVFLDADRVVNESYLENINKSITGSCVLVGTKVSINEKNKLSKRIKNSVLSAYLKYTNRTNNLVRSIFGLPYFIDGGNFVITTDIIEKIGFIGLEDKYSELEFSLNLASNDIKPIYCPYIVSGINIKNYDFSNPSIKNKISLFKHYFPLLITKNVTFREFIMLLLKPNSLTVLFTYILLIILSMYFPRHVATVPLIILGLWLIVNFVYSVCISKMRLNEVFWLMVYPFCLLWQKTKIFINNLTIRSIIESEYEEENINSATINASYTNGKKDFVCKLDLVSEDGMRKVVFREGNRFIVTDSYLRMYDAMEDIIAKLRTKGMVLKICQNCQNFNIIHDGSLDCLKGKCQISQSEILIWNGCQYFNPHLNNQIQD